MCPPPRDPLTPEVLCSAINFLLNKNEIDSISAINRLLLHKNMNHLVLRVVLGDSFTDSISAINRLLLHKNMNHLVLRVVLGDSFTGPGPRVYPFTNLGRQTAWVRC